MKTYPPGVLQNMNVETGPPNYQPVAETNWRMFGTLSDCQEGLKLIEEIVDKAIMSKAEVYGGIYSQFIYQIPFNTVHCRIVIGQVGDLTIFEYSSDIFDRNTYPMPFIDKYSPGQEHTLECQDVGNGIGQLYWVAV